MNFLGSVVALLVFAAHGLAPPHPDYEGWESVHSFRARHNISYAYRPRHISDEHCRHLSESACEREDSLAGTALVERRVAINTGNIKVLVLLCRFKDHVDHDLPSREYFDELFNGKRGSVNEVGSIREWLLFASMGNYKVTFDVQDWYTVPFTEAEFAAGKAGLRGAEEVQQLFAEKLSGLFVAGYNFFDLDTEGWGVLDGLYVASRDNVESTHSGPFRSFVELRFIPGMGVNLVTTSIAPIIIPIEHGRRDSTSLHRDGTLRATLSRFPISWSQELGIHLCAQGNQLVWQLSRMSTCTNLDYSICTTMIRMKNRSRLVEWVAFA